MYLRDFSGPAIAAAVLACALLSACVARSGITYEAPAGKQAELPADLQACRNQAALQRADEERTMMEVQCMKELGYQPQS